MKEQQNLEWKESWRDGYLARQRARGEEFNSPTCAGLVGGSACRHRAKLLRRAEKWKAKIDICFL
jgi:hypothetical protein